MRKFLLPALTGSLFLVLACHSTAEPEGGQKTLPAEEQAAADSKQPASAGEQAVRASLAKAFPGTRLTDVRKSPLNGLYEVAIGSEIGYVSADGKYLLHGDLLELGTQKNLTEQRRQSARIKLLADIGEKSMIVFSPKKPKHTISVFTDIDCGYCRKLHQDMKGYEAKGIAVRYLFFPRAGVNSESGHKADAVWCAKDRRDALTRAKRGETLPAGQCETPVAQHYQAGIQVGVRGTPAIIAEDGRLIPGYQPPAELLHTLESGG
jgi:thiol:disulfide interchange protein DsbC